MKASDAFCSLYIPDRPGGANPSAVQVKVGPGELRYAVGTDDDLGGAAAFQLWDGTVGSPAAPGAPATVSGTLITSWGAGVLGPISCRFNTGLVFLWSVGNNNHFFVVYR